MVLLAGYSDYTGISLPALTGFWGGVRRVGIFYEIGISCLGQTSTAWICVMWTIHESRAWEMECFIHNLKVIRGERYPETKISKEHKKNTYERKIAFNHLPGPKSMKSNQPSQKYSAILPLFP